MPISGVPWLDHNRFSDATRGEKDADEGRDVLGAVATIGTVDDCVLVGLVF